MLCNTITPVSAAHNRVLPQPRIAQYSDKATGWIICGSNPDRGKSFFLLKKYRLDLGLAQQLTQLVLEEFPPWIQQPGH